MSATLAPAMFSQFLKNNNSGSGAVGFKLFTYQAGTSTKQSTWTDSTQVTQNANPVVLDGNGVGNVWGDPTLSYKFVWAPANDTDPPASPIYSTDNLQFPLTFSALSTPAVLAIFDNQTFTGGPSDFRNMLFQRNASYSGGSPGTVNTCMEIVSTVGASAAALEWAFLSIMNNSSTGGENVAIYGQGNRQNSATGPTWAGVMEAIDNSAQADPTVALLGIEVDCRANGTDLHLNRVPIHVVASRPTGGGADVTIGIGLLIDNNGDTTHTSYGHGIFLGNKAGGTCTFNVGLNMGQGTYTSGAILVPQGAAFLWDVNGVNQLVNNGSGLDYSVSGTLQVRLMKTGGVAINTTGTAVQIIGPRINGYGTPTGGANQGSFAAGSITLPNLAAGVAQLILDLKTHGLLGT